MAFHIRGTLFSLVLFLHRSCCNGCWAFALAVSHSSFSSSSASTTRLNSLSSSNEMERQIHNNHRTNLNDYNASIIRGERDTNSTIPSAQQVAYAVGVVPPLQVSAQVWKRAWNLHRRVMPLLYQFDTTTPPDSSLALMCLWWKALSANDRKSPVFDNSLVYDLLPRGTRIIVGNKMRRFYPRLHHANVELRTAYLDQQLTKTVHEIRQRTPTKRIRLVTLGAGYDVRSIKFRERSLIDQAIELDLPNVIAAKQQLFHSTRFKRRRPLLTKDMLPSFYPVNLNHIDHVKEILTTILSQEDNNDLWYTIFLFEGVMIYLDQGIPQRLLEVCSAVLQTTKEGSLLFADRLENIPGGDYQLGLQVLAKTGWNLIDWQPKPGLARHMGHAELLLLPFYEKSSNGK